MSTKKFINDSDSLIARHCAEEDEFFEEVLGVDHSDTQLFQNETLAKGAFTPQLQRQVTTNSTTDGSTRASSVEKLKLALKDSLSHLTDEEEYSNLSEQPLVSNTKEELYEDLKEMKTNSFAQCTSTYCNRSNTISFQKPLGNFEKERSLSLRTKSYSKILPHRNFPFDSLKKGKNLNTFEIENKSVEDFEKKEKEEDYCTLVFSTPTEPLEPLKEEEAVEFSDENAAASDYSYEDDIISPKESCESILIENEQESKSFENLESVKLDAERKKLGSVPSLQFNAESNRRFYTTPINFSSQCPKDDLAVKTMNENLSKKMLSRKAKFVGVVSRVDAVIEGDESDPIYENSKSQTIKLPWHKRFFFCC